MSTVELAVKLAYLGSMVLALGLVALLWQNRDRAGAVPLAVLNLSVGFWMGCVFLSTVAPEPVAVFAIRVMYLGIAGVVASTVVFALAYTGREQYITRSTLAALSIHPVAVVLVSVTNPNSLFHRAIEARAIGFEQHWGPAFWVHTAYSYTLILVSMALLLVFLLRARHSLYRGQSLALVLAIVVGLLLNGLHTLGDVFFNTSALGFLGTAVLLTFGILRYRLTDLAPIARETVIDSIRDGMVVVDTNHRIVDSNQAAATLFDFPDSPIGRRVPELLSDYPELRAEYSELVDAPTESERTVQFEDSFLVVEATPVENGRGRHVGWLLLVQDITERVERERELEQKNERLDQFASMVSHDLRNPLNVAQGRMGLIAEAHDNEHAETVQHALGRMETMIEDMLRLARAGQTVETTEQCSLADLVREAWETVETDGVDLDARLNEETVNADPNRLLHVFENLFRNAIDHNTTPLTVRVGPLDGRAGFYVEDDGTGIPDDERDAVFEHGYTTGSGSGLGLAIVGEIVETHDWTITVTESDDGGARFEIETS
jgi:PAS domain S-box-containing protein